METAKKKSFVLGYSYVIHSFIAWLFMGFLMVTLSNVVFPAVEGLYGWNPTLISSMGTVGGVIGAGAGIFVGAWVQNKGPKWIIVIGFLCGGGSFILMGFASQLWLFIVSLFCAHIFSQMFCQMTTNNLISRWFVKKKGAVLGITTAGLPCATAIMVPLLNALNVRFGLGLAMCAPGAMMIIVGLISIAWVKNTPQEVGLTPDNLPIDPEVEREQKVMETIKFGQIARLKETWQIIFLYGFLFLANIACVASLVVTLVTRGYDQPRAVAIVGLSALFGILGSFVFGLIDQFSNTKIATLIYCILALAAYIGMFLAPAGWSTVFFCILMFGLNGAPGNLLPSMLITRFGPVKFDGVFKLIMPCVACLRAAGYVFGSLMVLMFGGNYRGIYLGLAVLMAISLILTLFIKLDKPVEIPPAKDAKA